MAITRGSWVVYERRGVEFVHVSKKFKTRREAENERQRLQQALTSKRKVLGVGFVRIAYPQKARKVVKRGFDQET